MRTTYDSRLLPSSYPLFSLLGSRLSTTTTTTTNTTSTILTSSRTSRETAKIKSPSSVKPRPFPFSPPREYELQVFFFKKKCQVGNHRSIIPSSHHRQAPVHPASLPSVDSVKKACRHFFFCFVSILIVVYFSVRYKSDILPRKSVVQESVAGTWLVGDMMKETFSLSIRLFLVFFCLKRVVYILELL